MELDVASAIEEILDRRKTVSIQGLGSLVLENYSAKLSEDGRSMKPPSAKLTFYNTQTKNKPLRKYIAEEYSITKDQATRAINKFSESVVNALSNYGEVNIKGVACIQRQGGEIHVKASDAYITKYYKGLPSVTLNKDLDKNAGKGDTDRAVEGKAAAATLAATTAATTAASKISPDRLSPATPTTPHPAAPNSPIAKPVSPAPKGETSQLAQPKSTPAPAKPSGSLSKPISPATAKPISPSPSKPVKKPPIQPRSGTATSSNESMGQSATGLSINELFSSNKPAAENLAGNVKTNQNKALTSTYTKTNDKLIPPTNTNNPPPPPVYVEEKKEWKGPFLGCLGLLLLCFLLYKGCNKIIGYSADGASSVVDASKESLQKAGDLAESTTAKANEMLDTDSEEDGATSDNDSEGMSSTTSNTNNLSECIIITGVFSRYKNIEKMINLVERNGYKSYQEEYGSYTRVGLTFDCEDVDLASYLAKVRRQISRRAWYLQPELYVEYK